MLKESLDNPIDTIRKLLALAERPGTPEEGEVARQQAERIAEKYGYKLDDIKLQPPAPEPPKKKPVNPFHRVLVALGWRPEYNPFHQAYAYAHNDFELRGHTIELNVDGWIHLNGGRICFSGKTPQDLYMHLRSNVH
jgi:hypothetical protein